MSPSSTIQRGSRVLRRLLREQTFDLRGLDPEGFRRWLRSHLERWEGDPVFVQRCRIRDLRRADARLRALEKEQRRAAAVEAASPQSVRLRALERDLIDADRAVTGLTAALADATKERRPVLRRKLAGFRARQRTLRREQAELRRTSHPWKTLARITAALERLRAETGLDAEEARLDALLRQRGHRSGSSGESFESLALGLTREHIVPDLLRGRGSDAAALRLRVLRGVTLGAARLQLDQVVVRLPRHPGRAVEVLAVVEAKRNINDLGHGFRRRQEDLSWLTGRASCYDPELFRTRWFPTGHFDRDAVHREGGEDFRFSRGSFRLFRPEPGAGPFLGRLYLITRAGPVWGISSADLARVAHRVATDERWELGDETDLDALRRWCQGLTGAVETPDVLAMYGSTPRRARQVLVVAR